MGRTGFVEIATAPPALFVALERGAEPLGCVDIPAPLVLVLLLRPGWGVLSLLAVWGLRALAPFPASFALVLTLAARARVIPRPALATPLSRVSARPIVVVVVRS